LPCDVAVAEHCGSVWYEPPHGLRLEVLQAAQAEKPTNQATFAVVTADDLLAFVDAEDEK